jgi:hypothetical protein
MIEALAHAGIPTIPVRVWYEDRWRKRPLAKWQQEASEATTDCEVLARWERKWPEALPGVPLAAVGWVAIDVDADDAAFWEIWNGLGPRGPYSKIQTVSGGWHFVFAQPDPPIGKMQWSERNGDVEILGTSCLLTVYDVEEILFPRVAPRAALPEVFRKPYAGVTKGPLSNKQRPAAHTPPQGGDVRSVAAVTDALFAMDVHDFHGEHDAWLAVARGAKFEGVSEADWVRWCLQDEWYLRDERIIRRKWHSLNPTHGLGLWAALHARGIKVTRAPSQARSASLIAQGSGGPTFTPTGNLQRRTEGLAAWLASEPIDDRLFTVAATFGEIILEGRIQRWVANALLEGDCRATGLWKSLGADRCRQTIANAYRHVEEKFLGERE